MVDYSIAAQIRPFQMPDIGQIYGNIQNIQMNRMRMAEAQETAQERNALRGLLSSGVDPYSQEGLARLRQVAPTLAPQYAQAASQQAYQRAQTARLSSQTQADQIKVARDLLSGVTNQSQWDAWRRSTVAALPQYADAIPMEFSPENVRRVAEGAEGLIRQLVVAPGSSVIDRSGNVVFTAPERPQRPVVGQGPGNIPTITDPERGTFRLATEVPAGAAGLPAAASGAAGPRTPTSQSDDPLRIDSAIRRAEGTGQNPRSSAQGQYQFLDSTFVEQFRRAFPQAAQGRSDAEVLRYRGAALPDGRRVEDVLGPAFTQQNMQTLTRAGVSPTGGNVYLAHHFGAQGALNLLRADPNTPIERAVPRQVLDANPFLRGSSVGQVTQWANNAVDYGPGEARRLLVAARQPSAEPGAPGPVNLMAPPPTGVNAMRPPTTVAEALEQRMLRELEQKRGEQRVSREDQPGRVLEAGETASAQEAGRLQARRTEARQQEAQQLERALTELRSITAPGGLLQTSTGSGIGAIRDNLLAFFGASTSGAQAAAALDPIADIVLKLVPRFEGPQSNADVQSYREAAGRLNDRTLPNATRLAAARELIRLFETRRNEFQYNAEGGTPAPTGGGQPVPTTTTQTSRTGQRPPPPAVGTVENGYRFRGGDPSNPSNWERQ